MIQKSRTVPSVPVMKIEGFQGRKNLLISRLAHDMCLDPENNQAERTAILMQFSAADRDTGTPRGW